MKLVVGLGNPGDKYNFTRHNFGFLALDYHFKVSKASWGVQPRLGAICGRIDDVLFIKPQDFYNESGRAVREYVKFYKIALEDVLVICDDYNLEFGKIRFRASGSAGGNNGLKSVIECLGTDNFARLRLGTGNEELRHKMGDTDFVLSKFTEEERAGLPEVLSEVEQRIADLVR